MGALKSNSHDKIQWFERMLLFQARGRITRRALKALAEFVSVWRIISSRSIPRDVAEGLMLRVAAAMTALEPFLGIHDRKGRAMSAIFQAPRTVLAFGPPANVDCAAGEHAYGNAKGTARSQRYLSASVANAAAWKHTGSVLVNSSELLRRTVVAVDNLRNALGPGSLETTYDGIFGYPLLSGPALTSDDESDMVMHLLKLEFTDEVTFYDKWVVTASGERWKLRHPGLDPLGHFSQWANTKYRADAGRVQRLRAAGCGSAVITTRHCEGVSAGTILEPRRVHGGWQLQALQQERENRRDRCIL